MTLGSNHFLEAQPKHCPRQGPGADGWKGLSGARPTGLSSHGPWSPGGHRSQAHKQPRGNCSVGGDQAWWSHGHAATLRRRMSQGHAKGGWTAGPCFSQADAASRVWCLPKRPQCKLPMDSAPPQEMKLQLIRSKKAANKRSESHQEPADRHPGGTLCRGRMDRTVGSGC